MDVKTVLGLARHKTLEITMQIYAKYKEERGRPAIEKNFGSSNHFHHAETEEAGSPHGSPPIVLGRYWARTKRADRPGADNGGHRDRRGRILAGLREVDGEADRTTADTPRTPTFRASFRALEDLEASDGVERLAAIRRALAACSPEERRQLALELSVSVLAATPATPEQAHSRG